MGVGGAGGLYGLPGRLCQCVRSPCKPVSRPLAAALALTHCGCGLIVFFRAGSCYVLFFSMQACNRPPGAIFFLLRRRKNMERKTPRRAGCSPPYEPAPLGGCRWCGWVSFDYQADLPVHPCPDSWCADRLPLRLRLRGCGCGLGDGVVGGFCVERSHAARRHAQRVRAPKAPLKGELAARNALSEGFCERASGAWKQ